MRKGMERRLKSHNLTGSTPSWKRLRRRVFVLKSRSLSLAQLTSLIVSLLVLVFSFVVPYCWAAPFPIVINDGASYTNSRTVTLTLNVSEPNIFIGVPYQGTVPEMSFRNSESSVGTDWEPYNSLKTWELTPGDGLKTVYVEFRIIIDLPNFTETSIPYGNSITLDTTPPELTITAPAANGTTITSSTQQVSWTAADATSGLNYIEVLSPGGNWVNVGFDMTYTLADLSNGDYSFGVRAFDNAGNAATATVNFAVNIPPAPITPITLPPWFPIVAGVGAAIAIALPVLAYKRRKKKEEKPDLSTLTIGDFVIFVEKTPKIDQWDSQTRTAFGVTGTGWIKFHCRGLPQLATGTSPAEGYTRTKVLRKVVSAVSDPQTEVTLEQARLINPGVKLGDNLEFEIDITETERQSLLQTDRGIIEHLLGSKGDALVKYENVTVKVDQNGTTGRIIEGKAVYPANPNTTQPISLSISGFTALIDSLTLTPTEGIAHINLQLPKNIASDKSCLRAELDLGETKITPACEFYVKKDASFGPWIIGDTGMIASGKSGVIADFSSYNTRTLFLNSGEVTGEAISPQGSNTGFITGKYTFSNAVISGNGLKTDFKLKEQHSFQTLQPLNYTISMQSGELAVSESRIVSGSLEQGEITFPLKSICGISPGIVSKARFSKLDINKNLDIVGEVDFENKRNAWGELTNEENKIVSWSVQMKIGHIYLPSGPTSSYSPDTGSAFLYPSDPNDLETKGITGVTVWAPQFDSIKIYSPDGPEGDRISIDLPYKYGWLRIGSSGMDGEISHIESAHVKQELGNKERKGYVGKIPFSSEFDATKRNLMGQFIDSAVYDSDMSGSVKVPLPCDFTLLFEDMGLTSTANLVGGKLTLPGKVKFAHWDLGGTQTGSTAGVISVRTGRLFLTGVDITEFVHFDRGFSLIWGEILANGNLGELFFDYNNYGQRFDKLPYSPHHIRLSEYRDDPKAEAYLATCGSISFNFFGEAFVNIKDAKDARKDPPYRNRLVTVPKQFEPAPNEKLPWPKTNLYLHGEWNNKLAIFDFPDEIMKYNEEVQNGFKGEKGSTEISFIKSNALGANITTREDSIDICLYADETHTIDFSDLPKLGNLKKIRGCIRIKSPTLERLVINGYIEDSNSSGGILNAKAAGSAEVLLSITPTSCTLMASGVLYAVILDNWIEVSGYVHLTRDYAAASIEGDLVGRVDCGSAAVALAGEGQLNWFIGPQAQYLQGKVSLELCTWVSESGIEGGLFIGNNCPVEKAHVLTSTGNEHFHIPPEILDAKTITGVYGYGLISSSLDLGFFGGGCALFAGMGALFTPVPKLLGAAGLQIHGEILWGLVSASAWADLTFYGGADIPIPYFEGTVGLEGCILWVLCASIELTAGLNSGGFYLKW